MIPAGLQIQFLPRRHGNRSLNLPGRGGGDGRAPLGNRGCWRGGEGAAASHGEPHKGEPRAAPGAGTAPKSREPSPAGGPGWEGCSSPCSEHSRRKQHPLPCTVPAPIPNPREQGMGSALAQHPKGAVGLGRALPPAILRGVLHTPAEENPHFQQDPVDDAGGRRVIHSLLPNQTQFKLSCRTAQPGQ